jgi:dihydrofolate reductase
MNTFEYKIYTMGKLILEIQTSIDGFIAAQDGDTNWMLWNWGPEWVWEKELQQYHTELNLSADGVFISRQMAEEGFNAHWQSAAENPDDPRYKFAKHITNTPKIVFSKTLNKSIPIPGGWNNTDIAEGDYISAARALKSKYENILVYGGATFVSSLISAGLIDQFHFLVNPVAVGKGLSIFNTLDAPQNMTLVKSASFGNMILLHYKLNS